MLHNTLTRRKEEFAPQDPPRVSLYTCGPTVYGRAHVGNFRTYIFEDVLRRTLEYNGFEVRQVMNITDVGHLTSDADEGEDKMALAARRERKTAWEIAEEYTALFKKDIAALGITEPTIWCKATDHIKEQIALIETLERKGFTYPTSDGIYFDTSKFPAYGRLSGQSLAEKKTGARVDANPEKRNPTDFALWKLTPTGSRGHPERPSAREGVEGSPLGAAKGGSLDRARDDTAKRRDMEWPSPWGTGFPGWHIECSAMSQKHLGETIDIHTGGVDHIAVHHENEIAQSEAATGKPFVRFWLHGEFLTLDERRIGKSEGNMVYLDDLRSRGFHPLAFRYLVLGVHYRVPLSFSWEAMQAAQNALQKLVNACRDLPPHPSPPPQRGEGTHHTPSPLAGEGWDEGWRKKFLSAINNDLATPQALAVVWSVVDDPQLSAQDKSNLLSDFDRVLGLGLNQYLGHPVEVPADIQTLLDERESARAIGDFARADQLRDQIHSKGFTVEDTSQGTKLRTPLLAN